MPETRQELQSKLTKARQELAESRGRVTELEAILSEDQPSPSAPLDREGYQPMRALEEIRSLAKFPSENVNPVLRVATDGTLLYANPGSHRLLALWDCAVGKRLPEYLQRVVSESFAGEMSKDVEVECGDIHYSLTFVPLVDAGYINIYGQDITQRIQTETAVKRYGQRMEILHEIDTGIIGATSIEAVVETSLKHVRTFFACQQAGAALFDFATNEVLIFALDLNATSALSKGSRYPIPPGFLEEFGASTVTVIDDIQLLQEPSPTYRQLIKEGMRSSLRAMLIVQGHPIGVLSLIADTPGYFTTEHQEIAGEIANQLTIAIRQLNMSEELTHHAAELEQNNAALKQAETSLQRSTQRLEILHEIDTGIIGASSIQTLLEVIVKHLRTLIPCPRVAASLIDQKTGEAVIFAIDLNSPSELGEGVRTILPANWFDDFDADNTRVIEDYRLLPDPLPAYRQLIKEGIVTTLQVLLMDRDRTIGVFGLSADTPGFFTADHRKIAAEIASQLSIAIRQLQLSEEIAHHAIELEHNNTDLRRAEISLQRYAQRMEILHQIDLGLIRGGSIQALVDVTLKHLRQLIPCQRTDVSVIDETTGEALVFAVGLDGDTTLGPGVRVPIPPNIFDGYDARHVRVFDDFRGLQDTQPRARRLVNEGLLCALSALLMHQEHPIGVLGLFADTPGYFTAEHQEIAAEIASQLAIAIWQLQLSEALAHHTAKLEQKVAERTAALSAAKERVEAILNNSTDGILLVHTDLNIQQANSSFNTLFACEPDDYFGKSLVSLVHAEDVDLVSKTLQAVVAEQQSKSIEIRTLRKDGKIFDAELSIGVITDDGLVCTIRDITERKAQERQLWYQASLQENVSDAVIVTDMKLSIQSWNRAAEHIYGWRADEVIGRTITEIIQSRFDDETQGEKYSQDFIKMGWWRGEIVAHHKDGREIQIQSSNNLLKDEHEQPLGMIAINQDITERKAQERQLRYQASLQQNVSDAVIVTDPEFRIQSWNLAAERIYGWRAEEIVNRATAEILRTQFSAPDERERSEQQLREQGWWQGEVIQHHKDGGVRHILGSVSLVKDEKGAPMGIVSINHDITERKLVEEALHESEVRFGLLVNSVRDYAIYMLDPRGNVTTWNQGAQRIKGYTSEEIIGQNFERFYPPEAIARGDPQRMLNTASIEGHSAEEGWRVRKDGTRFWAEVVITPLRDQENQVFGYAKVTRDLTERKRAEEALNARLEEEHEFQGYLKALHEITIELTQIDALETFYKRTIELGLERLGFERLTLFLYNEQDGTALGTYGTDPQGKIVDEHHLRITPAPNGIMQRAFERSERFYIDENAPLYKDREPVGIGWNAATVLWNGTQGLGWLIADNLLRQTPASKPLLDILGLYSLTVGTLLAQKQVQIALRKSEARYRLLADSINDVVIRFGLKLEYLYVSPSSRTVLGYEPAELLGASNYQRIHPDDVLAIQELIKGLQERPSTTTITYRFRHKDGHYVWLESSGRAVVSEQTGAVVEFVFSGRDITQRKATEEALRESEEKFRLLLDAAPVATIISDQLGRVTLVNVQAEDLFGFNRAELIGQSIDVLLPDSARERHADKRATYTSDPRVRKMGGGLELFARRKDGSEFPVEIELSYVETQAGLLVMSFVVDITERKQNAAVLERQRAFLQRVIDLSPSMIFVKDYDARFVLVNRLVAQLYNTTVEALIGKSDADFNPSLKEVQDFLEADRRVIASGEPLFLEEPITNFTGETHWLQTTKVPIVSADSKLKYVLGVSTDITERKQAEIALREQHEFLQQVINTVPGLISVKDRAGRFQLVNDLEAEIYGSTPADMLGKTNADFNPNQAEVDFFVQKDRETLETGQTLFIPEETVMGRYYQTSKIPLRSRTGEYDRLLVVASDITERKNGEEALRQALEKEKELNELKSRFVSMASHEFRTPLASILALTETLSAYRQKMADEQIEQRLGKIRDQVGHLKDIMDDVLLLARMQARRVDFNPVKLDLDDLCRSVLDEFQSRADVTQPIEYTCNTEHWPVRLDKKLMRQIISNLASNAIKYSPPDKPIKVSLDYASDALVLGVSDEGIGIPEADLIHLFEPFHRAANVGAISGTGLGLVITKESVELHGGTITVESHIGMGTKFTVTIPVTTEGVQTHDQNPGD